MIQIIDNLLGVFTDRVADRNYVETIDRVECKFVLNELKIPSLEDVLKFKEIPYGDDSLRIFISIQGWGDITFFSSINNAGEFLNDIKEKAIQIDEGDIVNLKIVIEKKIVLNTISIYSLDSFSDYLMSLSFEQLLKTLFTISENQGLIFRSSEIVGATSTTLFKFCPINDTDHFNADLDFRQNRIGKIQGNVYTSHLSSFSLISDDFIFISAEPSLHRIQYLFKRIAFGLFIVSIYDITNIEDDKVFFKLNGYKAINGLVNLSTVLFEQYYDEYHLIYNWVYGTNNVNDRLGLARNIISLHLDTPGEVGLKGKVFQSVLSSYKVYEKQNVKQYIEIRNKISDQLLDFNKRATQIVDSFASGFQKSSITVLTLFSSILGIKLLSNTKVTYLFTFYSTVLSLVFLIISILYLGVSVWEVREQRKRFRNSYNNLKRRYTDLLEEDDIKKILNDDAEYNEDISFINSKLKSYTLLWLSVLILILLSTILFYYMSCKHLTIERLIEKFVLLFQSVIGNNN